MSAKASGGRGIVWVGIGRMGYRRFLPDRLTIERSLGRRT